MRNSDKIREPQQNRSITTKEKIINSGINIFSSKSYHDTTSKEIAKNAGVGIGSFYDYFQDKKDLLMTILVRHRTEVTQNLDSIQSKLVFNSRQNLSIKEKISILSAFINYIIDFHENCSKFHSQIPKLRYLDPDIECVINRWEQKQIETIYNILKNPVLEINLKDIKIAAILVHRTTEDIAHHIIDLDDESRKIQIKKGFIDMISKYLFY